MAIRSSIQSIDYQTLIKNTSIAERVGMTGTRSGQALLASLSPTELAAAFPDYYRRASPDVSGFISAQTKKREGRSGVEPSATAAPSTRLPSRASAPGNYTTGAESVVRAEAAWRTELSRRTGVSIGSENSDDAASLIRRKEGYRSRPYWDVNAWRIGYGSDTVTRPDGTYVKVTPGMEITREDAERDLRRRIPEFQRQGIITHVGENAWEKLNPQTKAAITSLAYNYGSIARLDALKRAIQSNDKNMIAQAIESYAGHNKGVNFNRRMEEARMIRNSSDVPTSSTMMTDIPSLPQGLAPNLVEEYNRMSPRQKSNFHAALGKLDQDPASAVEKMNQIYQQNPAIVDRAAAQGLSFNYTNVAFSSDRIRSGVSQLSQETQATLQRLDSFGVPVTVTSTFRSPEQNARTPGAARTSMHMSGNAVDVRTNGKSPGELQRTVQALKRAGFNRVLIENDHIHAEVHPGSDNFSVSLRPGHSNRNISLDQAREAAGAVAFREPVQQRSDDINAPERRRKEVQTDQPRQESTTQPVQEGDINRPERVRAEQQGQTVFVGGDSIGQGVATASRATNLAASGRRFTSDAMFNQLTRVPKGGTFHMYAGTNDAANGVVDPEAYDRQMARMAQFAKENNINLKIYGPHKSNKDWDERFGNTVDRNMADAAARYGISYTSNRSVAANAGDGVHFDGDAYAALAMRNNIIPAMADGGSIEGVEDASKLTAIPMKSGRDDMLLMNQGEPVAKVNSEEKLTYDNERNRVTVTPKDRANADDLTAKMEERQQEIKDAPVLNQPQLAPNKPIEQVAPYTPERDFVNPVVPTDAALNDSMRRVMSRNEFREEGSHFSFGASNFST